MVDKKLYAFSKSINSFLNMSFNNVPITVYGKDLKCQVLVANSYQLEAVNVIKLQDILGLSMYDLLSCLDDAERVINNDMLVITQGKTNFFIEEGDYMFDEDKLHKPYFSIKTTLNDSGNNVVGCFGLSCFIESVSLAKFAAIMNKLNLMSPASILPAITFPFLNHSFNVLTVRERECVYYLIRGMAYKEIARALNISSRTIETHIEHIKNKLGCYSRSDIVGKVFELQDSEK